MLFLISLLLLFTAVLGQHPVCEAPGRLQTRIIGGQFIPVHHLPHQVVIRQLSFLKCGAVLIAPQWLLTAQHCLLIPDLNQFPMDVYLGVSRIEQIDNYSPNRTEGVVKRRVVRYFRGPWVEIGDRTEDSDLLLLKLDRKVENSVNIKPIELPEVGTRWIANQTAVTSGFGKISPDDHDPSNDQPRTLQYTKVPILSKRQCLAMTRKLRPDDYSYVRLKVAPESILCAGYEQGGPSSCHGDSGGPLSVCATPLRDTSGGELLCKDNRWLLAGVISGALKTQFGNKCGDPNHFSLHPNVPVFTEWIRRTIRNN